MALSLSLSPSHYHPQFRKQALRAAIPSSVKETLALSPSISNYSTVLLGSKSSNILSPLSLSSNCSCASSISPPGSDDSDDDSTPTRIFIKGNLRTSTRIGLIAAGLPKSTSEGTLRREFSRHGKVTQVKIMIDNRSRESLGFAYIWFADKESAQLAIKEMDGKFFEGRFVYVTIAKPGTPKMRAKANPYKF